MDRFYEHVDDYGTPTSEQSDWVKPSEDTEQKWRRVWGEMFREHRDMLIKSRGEGANQFSIEVINAKATAFADESCRMAIWQHPKDVHCDADL